MTQITRPQIELRVLQEDVVSECLHPYDGPFANNDAANNHLDFGYDDLPTHSPLIHRVVTCATGLVVVSDVKPQFIASVPKGADGWADDIAVRLGTPFVSRIRSKKMDKRVFDNTAQSEKIIADLKDTYEKPHGIVIDDATTDGGTTEAYADFLSEQDIEIDFILSLFFRGMDIAVLHKSKYKRAVLLAKSIPMKLDWGKYNDHGIIQ